ncbi:MAG: amidohydrolase family protein [Bacteroidota bacterium]
MRYLTAEYIFHPDTWLQQHVLEVNEEGTILDLRPIVPGEQAEDMGTYLVPGFVNAHCHLELSYLEGKISRGTGMSNFAASVIKSRGMYQEDLAQEAVEKAIKKAYESGVVAFGDIANGGLTAPAKKEWQDLISFHTYIELLGLAREKANEIMENGLHLLEEFEYASLSLHAPYSISPSLKQAVYQTKGPFSIHLLESKHEIELFQHGSGPMKEFYDRFGIPFSPFPFSNPLTYITEGLPTDTSVLWVHLLEASPSQLETLGQLGNSHFCLCPKSNVYIHEKGPDILQFLPYSDRICLGTDSLASNDSLSIWEEVLWIRQYFPSVDFHQLIRWASYQGAQALGMDHLGSFQAGTRPGILTISGTTCQPING